MSDEPFYSPKFRPAPRREPKAGERLFEFSKGDDRFVCELRDPGEFGIKAQFLINGELYIAQTFREQPAIARTLAIAWGRAPAARDGGSMIWDDEVEALAC